MDMGVLGGEDIPLECVVAQVLPGHHYGEPPIIPCASKFFLSGSSCKHSLPG